MQFIAGALVEAARVRRVAALVTDPLVFGLDCARFGDDHSTLAIRRGRGRLRQLGVENVQEIWFGSKGRDALWAGQMPVRTANKRTEMWTNMRGWLDGGAIPDDADALALTFAEPVMPRDLIEYLHPTRHVSRDEDHDDLYRDLRDGEDIYREIRGGL